MKKTSTSKKKKERVQHIITHQLKAALPLLVSLLVMFHPFRSFKEIKAKSLSLGNFLLAIHL
ncbi:hypothetical protein H5410_038300 [Solanum commersonii]|uniref:Uncharacterized protein n=1 Tax=Solanum commersonii TaxID=4109 RepID=A0A9J5YCR3_SOLCO|nr:hypothetical protein H5410_038300 [Solanum commersonii]